MEKDKNRPEGEQAYEESKTENTDRDDSHVAQRQDSNDGSQTMREQDNADSNQTMREQIDKDCRSQERRKQIERDVYLHNKYENPDYLNRTMPESARWHWQRKPYDGKYK